MSRYRDSLSSPLFFHFSIDHCRRRGGCEARGCFGRKCDLSRAMRLSRSLSLDRSPFSIVAGSTDVYLDAAIIGLVFLLRVTRVSRLV